MDEWMKKMWYRYTVEYYVGKKKGKDWNIAIWDNMDGPRDYHSKWCKPDRQRQVSYDTLYMWNLKKKKDTNVLFYKTEIDS